MNTAFAHILQQNRAAFNAQFAQARHSAPALDGDEFSAHLRNVVAPIVEKCDEIQPARTNEVAQTLYEISLQLMSKGWIGAQTRNALLPRAWTELLPACANIVVLAPRNVVGSVCNAVVGLSQTRGANGERWLKIMSKIAPLCADANAFLQAGRVAAWHCGLASSRENAIKLGRELAPEIARVIFNVAPQSDNTQRDDTQSDDATVADLWNRLANDVWFAPENRAAAEDAKSATSSTRCLELKARVGDFSGFGGEFSSPPRVALVNGEVCVFEKGQSWRLFADAFGATLWRVAPQNVAFDHVPVEPWKRVLAVFPEAKNLTSLAFDGQTIALTLPTSHRVWLFA